MQNRINILFAFILGNCSLSYGQNIAINTSGSAAAATNMFEVTQTNTAANMVALYAIHSGAAAGTGYGFQAIKTGASTTNIAGYFSASGGTSNYAIIVPSTGGNVGIGLTAPTYKFEVRTAADNFGLAHTDGTRAFSTWLGTYAGFSGSWIGSQSNHGLALTTNDLGRLYITNTGYVGIGTTTPNSRLHSYHSDPAIAYNILSDFQPALTANQATNLHGTWNQINTASAFHFNCGLYGAVNRLNLLAGQTGTVTAAHGSTNDIVHTGTGTIGSAYGSAHAVSNNSTATINNAFGVTAAVYNSGGGTITNSYGLHVSNIQGTNKWSLYAADAGAPSYFAGNVGIGITAPAAKLDVVYPGTVNTFAAKILHSGNAASPGTGLAVSNGYPTSSASGSYEVFGTWGNSFGSSFMSVRDNGNVGIGTTTPFGQLHINTANQASFLMSDTRTAGNQVGRVIYDGGTTVTGGGWVFQKMTDAGAFSANLMTIIQNTGNVGVGRLNPDAQLHVNNTFKVGDLGTGINQTLEAYPANGDVYVGSATQEGDLFVRTLAGANNVHFSGGSSSHWINSGSVGIGTTTPETKLHVVNELTTTPRGILNQQSSNDGNSAFLVLRKGRGTAAAPAAVANGDQLGTLYSEGYDGSAFLRSGSFIKFSTNGAIAVGSIPTDIVFNTGSSGTGTERLRILSTGNVGIGTPAPSSLLTLEGGYIQGTAETWGHQARTQGLIIMPEGAVSDDGAGNVVFGSTVIIMNPLSGSYIRIAAGNYTFGVWSYMWVDIPPTTTRGTVVTPTVSNWVDGDRAYDNRDRILIAQRNGGGQVFFNFAKGDY